MNQKQPPRKGVLRNSQNSQENTCASLFFNKVPNACNLILKKSLAQMFSCEFCEISKNTFSYRTPPVAASDELNTVLFVKDYNTPLNKRKAYYIVG